MRMKSDNCIKYRDKINEQMKLHFRSETQMRYCGQLAPVHHHGGKLDPEALCSAATETAHP